MVPAPAQRALSTLAAAVVTPALDEALRARWRAGGRNGVMAQCVNGLSEELCAVADQLAAALTVLTHGLHSDRSVEILIAAQYKFVSAFRSRPVTADLDGRWLRVIGGSRA